MTVDPTATRQIYLQAWQKALNNEPLTHMETIIVEIITRHPEYHALLSSPHVLSQTFALEENPFFHLSLHVALAEQIQANRPAGIVDLYQKLLTKYGSQTLTEHKMIECLVTTLQQGFGNETLYLQTLQRLI